MLDEPIGTNNVAVEYTVENELPEALGGVELWQYIDLKLLHSQNA